jgi:hypothetical protein
MSVKGQSVECGVKGKGKGIGTCKGLRRWGGG